MQQANKSQIEAINEVQQPCMIIAGAGSGKTKVIVEKIINLINNNHYNPEDIFALTFTNKAAKEMDKRIQKKINLTDKVWISTFHSLGIKIIKAEAKHLNIKKNFSSLTKT